MCSDRRNSIGAGLLAVALATGASPVLARSPGQGDGARAPAQVVAEAPADAWRPLEPENTVYFEVPSGRFVLELAPWSAPAHVENLRALVRGGHFDGGAIVRSQDNYVAQWGARPSLAEGPAPEGIATSIPPHFTAPSGGLPFTPLPDPDVYAPEAGFTLGFPVGRDPRSGRTWIAHCYGVVAVARGNDPSSGNGGMLAAVTGHGPRHLDRNSAIVGRVVLGMEHLTTLPRGTGGLGFYETDEERVQVVSARIGSDLPAEQRAAVEILRTESPAFRDYVMAYRSRVEEWFVHRADRIDLCNVRIPVRSVAASSRASGPYGSSGQD